MNPWGVFDNVSVADAYNLAAAASAAVVAILVVVCYLWTRQTLGPGFKRRWVLFFVITGALCFGFVWLVLQNSPTHALADSCQSNPAPFPRTLPVTVIAMRAVAGLAWGMLAFVILSWLCTFTIGRWAGLYNGFFHNRGWPWPRALTGK